MRVLLTGGLGYLGGRLTQALLAARDHDVVLGTRRTANPPFWAPQAKVVTIDWSSMAELERACDGVDAIVHLAGMNAPSCAKDPVAALECNGGATARLVRAAIGQGVTRFIYLSTAHVYGIALTASVNEDTCPQPRHPYATSHRAGEDVVRSAHEEGTIQGVVLRLSNSFGAPADPGVDCWSLITNDLCRQAVQHQRMVLRTAGHQRRDFIALAEVCRAVAHLLVLPGPGLQDGVFNVGSGWAPTLLGMRDIIAERIEALLRFRPEMCSGTVNDGTAGALEFGVQKLLSTGFELRREALIEELDALIEFCARHREVLRA